jgi:phosphatidylglycerol:prolipoprotein diacylglycerol transferase
MSYPFLSDLVRDVTGLDLPLPLPMFGLCVAAAMLVTLKLTELELRRMHVSGLIPLAQHSVRADGVTRTQSVPAFELTANLGMLMAIVGIIGAKAFHLLEYSDQFFADPFGMIFSRNGFTIFGGLICGVLAASLYARRHRIALRELADALAPALMLGYAIGRIGCQISGDGDWGVAADLAAKPSWLPLWFWAQTYEGNIAGVTIAPPGVYPTPIYETLMGVLAFALLWSLRKHGWQAGWLFSLFLVLTGIARFLIEQIRVNIAINWFGIEFTQAELIALGFIVLGLIGLIFSMRRRRTITPALG